MMSENDAIRGPLDTSAAIRAVDAIRYSGRLKGGQAERSDVVVESSLTITVEGVGSYTVMCTPSDLKALAVGFVFSEGMISDLDDINVLALCEDQPDTVRLEIRNPRDTDAGRTLVVSSSCGACGGRHVEDLMAAWSRCGDSLRVPAAFLNTMAQHMSARQKVFSATGGTHAAAIFSASGDIIGFGEDIGRHNALDKAIGKCLLSRRQTKSCGVVLSGRVSFELVAKAVRAELELMAAVSAPTSLAIDAAERAGITLCAFVRDDRATVYTHRHRVTG